MKKSKKRKIKSQCVKLHRKRKRRHRKNKVQRICKFIISICMLFTFTCLGYMLFYSVKKVIPKSPELIQEMDEVAEYYVSKDMQKEQINENKLEIPEEIEAIKAIEAEQAIDSPELEKEEIENQSEQDEKDDLRILINSAHLNPERPGNVDLALLLDRLMPEITEGCRDTYESVKVCYDYLIENCSYSQTVKYTYEQDAYLLLTEFRGSCTYYAAAFHYMMRYIGLDDQLVSGYRYLESGRSFHRWNEITIDDIPYIFDTQWEDTLSRGDGIISYDRFCKTYAEVKDYYDF